MDQVEWFCYFEYLNYNKTLLEALQSEVFFGGVFWTRFYSFPLPHSDVLLIFHMIRNQKSDSYNTNILVITPSKCPIILSHKGFSVCSFAWGANSMWSTPFLSCFFLNISKLKYATNIFFFNIWKICVNYPNNVSKTDVFFCKISDIFVKYLKGFSKIPYVQKRIAYRRKGEIRWVHQWPFHSSQ